MSRFVCKLAIMEIAVLLCADDAYANPLVVTLTSLLRSLSEGVRARVFIGCPSGSVKSLTEHVQRSMSIDLKERIAGLSFIGVAEEQFSQYAARPDLPATAYL